MFTQTISHQRPDSVELREALAEQDPKVAHTLGALEQKAGANRSVADVTAGHGMPRLRGLAFQGIAKPFEA